MKNIFKKKMIRKTLLGLSLSLMMVAGVFVNNALADVSVTAATGGTNISLDTTSEGTCVGGSCHTGTALGNIVITESAAAEIATGSHILTLPAGWNFTSDTVTITTTNGTELRLASQFITPGATTLSFNVQAASVSGPEILTIIGIKVHPTGATVLVAADMTHSGTGAITGVVNGTTSFASLSTAAGTITKLGFTTQPSETVYGEEISDIVIKTQDQFGNASIIGLDASETVNLSKQAGDGTLSGTVEKNIGTGAGNGIATFDDLKFNHTGAHQLTTGNAANYTNVNSNSFSITARPISITAQTNTKTYDGNTSSVAVSTLTAGSLATGDTGTYSQTYDNKNYSVAGKTLTPGVVIRDAGLVDMTSNYTVTPITDATGVINKKAITITAAANEKVYNDNTAAAELPTITVGALVDGDVGVYIETYDNRNVGVTKTLTPAVVSIVDGSTVDMTGNYAVTLTPVDLGTITARPVNVTAQTNTKVYNAGVTSVATPVGDALQGNDTWVSQGTQAYDTKDVGTGKTLTASGASITESGNYTISYVTNATGVITAKGLTVTDSAVTSKTYDGTTTATITGATLAGVEGGEGAEVVALATATSGTFDTKNVGVGKAVTPAMTLTGTGTGNYTLAQPTLTGTITTKAITITAAANEKVYNGDTTAAALPTITVGALVDGDIGTYIETYDNRNVGVTKTLTPAVVSIVDGSTVDMTGNYAVTLTPVDLGTITVYAITVTAGTDTKVYDGNTTSDGAPSVTAGALQTGDTIAAITQTYDTRDVGTGKTLTASGVVSDGNSGNNYTLTLATNATGEITARPITVTAATDTKVYDDNTSSDGVPTVTGGSLVGGDVISAMTQTYATKTVGSNKTINAAGVVTDGNSGNNYTVTFVANATGVIRHGSAASFAVTPSSLTPTTADTLNVVVTALDSFGNTVDGGNGATAFTGIVFLTTDATAPVWYNQVGNITTGGTKTFTSAVKFSTVEDDVTITAENSGATVTGTSATIDVSAGPTTPTVAVTAPTAGATLSGTSTLTFTTNGGATTAAFVSIDGATYVAATTNANPGTYSLDTTALSNGSHTLRVKDTVSTLTGYSDYVTFLVSNGDSNAPVVNSITVGSIAQTTATLTVVTDEVATCKYATTDIAYGSMALMATTTGVTTHLKDLTSLTAGTSYNYYVRCMDASSNTMVTSAHVYFTTSAATGDTTPPPVPVITTATTTIDADSYTISGTAAADTPSDSARTIHVYKGGSTLVGTAYIPVGQTTWSVNVSLTQNADNSFTAKSTDAAGYQSAASDAVVITESAGAEPTEVSVTKTSLVKRIATKNGLFADGWRWVLDVTIPTASTTLAMSFDNLTGAGTILAASNIRFYSAQSSDHTSASPIVISAAGAGTSWSSAMTLNDDLESNTVGRQIQITIQAAVPSGATDGAYSASYDIQ